MRRIQPTSTTERIAAIVVAGRAIISRCARPEHEQSIVKAMCLYTRSRSRKARLASPYSAAQALIWSRRLLTKPPAAAGKIRRSITLILGFRQSGGGRLLSTRSPGHPASVCSAQH
jgi:hypothetical protein